MQNDLSKSEQRKSKKTQLRMNEALDRWGQITTFLQKLNKPKVSFLSSLHRHKQNIETLKYMSVNNFYSAVKNSHFSIEQK